MTITGLFVNTLVRDDYDRLGLLAHVHDDCPESDTWIAGQEHPITNEEIDGYWATVYPLGGGSVCIPAGRLTIIRSHLEVASILRSAIHDDETEAG